MKLVELLNELVKRCDKQNDLSVIDILSRNDIQNLTIKEDVAKSILSSRLSTESIKKSAFAKKHFTALALGAADVEIMRSVKILQLSDNVEKELSLESNTYEKQRKLTLYIKDVIDKLKKKYEEQLIDLTIKLKLTSMDYMNEVIPVEHNVLLAKALIDKEMKGNVDVVWEDNSLKLKKLQGCKVEFFDHKGEVLSFDSFVNQVLASNGLLKNTNKVQYLDS